MVIVIYEALCFDVAQGRMNRAPNETRLMVIVDFKSSNDIAVLYSEAMKVDAWG